jgi:hypothetical protein
MRFRLGCPRRVRRLWRHAAELASRTSGARLPAWGAAEAIAAEGLAGADAAEAEPPTASTRPALMGGGAAGAIPVAAWEAVTEALPDAVERLMSDADHADPFQLDARLRAAVRALQRIDFQTGRLLRLVADLRLHRALGFRSLPDYVRERLCFSPRKARTLLALDRRLQELPNLAAAYRDGQLSLARALVLLPVVLPATEAAWVARAQEVTVRRLGDLVDWALEAGEPGHPPPPPPADGTLVPPATGCRCVRAAATRRCSSTDPPRSWRSSGRRSARSPRGVRRPGRASSGSSATRPPSGSDGPGIETRSSSATAGDARCPPARPGRACRTTT